MMKASFDVNVVAPNIIIACSISCFSNDLTRTFAFTNKYNYFGADFFFYIMKNIDASFDLHWKFH